MTITSIKHLVVHCAATPATMDIGAADIRDWHKARGWSDIGYHVVIRRKGSIEYGRPFDTMGAHVKGHNKTSIGICLVGGVDKQGNAEDNFTDEQYKSLERVLSALHLLFPDASVLGHKDFAGVTKECPCFDIKGWCKERWIRYG